MTHPVNLFFSAWGESDADARGTALSAVLAQDVYYADPNTPDPLHGADAVIGYIAMFSANMPGGGAAVAALDEHNGHVRATVDFLKDGTAMMRGQYFADLEAGKITRLVGFTGMGDNT